MRNTIARRVRRGAELLDRERPGWADEISTARLDVAQPWNCVLGQLYDSFSTGRSILDMTMWSAARHGFIPSLWAVLTCRFRSQNDRLTDAWLDEIRTRRHADAAGLRLGTANPTIGA